MSNQTGIDYDVLLSGLHGGLCAFKNLRAHRRYRESTPAPAPTPPAPAEPVTPPPAPCVDLEEPGGASSPPPEPRLAPESLIVPPATPAPATPASLKLPLPTMPPHLGHMLLGQPAASSEAAPKPEPSADHGAATIHVDTAAVTAVRRHDEAVHLENVHAEHRACLAILLRDHRDELRSRAEAEAARTAQMMRDLLVDHRAELARAADTHAERLTAMYVQHREAMAQRHEAAADRAGHDSLQASLAEHASTQREALEHVAQHIADVTTAVAGLGQTVNMLAVATYEARQASTPTTIPRRTFAPPPLCSSPYAPSPVGVPPSQSAPTPTAASPTPIAPPPPPVAASPTPTSTASTLPTPTTGKLTLVGAADPATPSLALALALPSAADSSTPATSRDPPRVSVCAVMATESPKLTSVRPEAPDRNRVFDFCASVPDDDPLMRGVPDDPDEPRCASWLMLPSLARDDAEEHADV